MATMKWFAALLGLLLACSVQADQVPNFSFKDLDGRQHSFAEYRGKWVVLNYWSTYCGPCLKEIPALRSISQRYRDKVVVLGMDAGETPETEMRQFIRQRGINYLVAPTQDSTMYAMGLIYGVPTTYIVNPQGRLVDTHMGVLTVGKMQEYLGQQNNAPRTASDRASGVEK